MSTSSSQSNGVHFFKIVQKRNLRDGELKVPASFVKKYWEVMSNPVTLRLPNKTEWKVSWKKEDGDIWFCNNGWKEFAEYVPLSELQFVVFHYEGNSCFNVIVLSKNGLEIKYKETRDTNTTTAAEEEEEEIDKSDCSVKILDDPPSLPAKRLKSPPQSSQPLKKKKITNGKKVEAHSSFDNAKHLKSGSSNDKKRIKKFHEYVKKRFPSKKDFFTCAMYKTYVNTDQMVLPREFSKQHLHKMDGRSVTLFDVNKKRTWDVQLKKCYNGQFTFTNGWIKFSRDNSLEIGDVCAFVFIKSKGLSFQVHHFPLEKDISTTPHFEVNNSDQEGLLNRPSSSLSPPRKPDSKWISDENKFVVVISKTPSQMTISIKYIKNFISESGKTVTLRVGENSWHVKVLLYEYEHHSHARFSKGWPKFIQDCQLKEGDSCCFKMVDEDKLEFEVTINFNSKLLN